MKREDFLKILYKLGYQTVFGSDDYCIIVRRFSENMRFSENYYCFETFYDFTVNEHSPNGNICHVSHTCLEY